MSLVSLDYLFKIKKKKIVNLNHIIKTLWLLTLFIATGVTATDL